MALAAIYDGRSSKATVKFIKGHLAIDTWNAFEDRTTRAIIPKDHISEFLSDLATVIEDEVANGD